MRSCCCTNQCPACGQCCQVGCGHRRTYTYATGTVTPIAPRPLTEEDIRRIIREEINRGGAA